MTGRRDFASSVVISLSRQHAALNDLPEAYRDINAQIFFLLRLTLSERSWRFVTLIGIATSRLGRSYGQRWIRHFLACRCQCCFIGQSYLRALLTLRAT